MTYTKEFPDFDPATMPAIPRGFVDCSWHNDACPSFQNEASGLIIFIDYADKALSELPSVPRFSLSEIDPEEEGDTGIASSDDWSEILAHILARAFADSIESNLSADELAECKRRNATAEYSGGICATHDFRDANMNMLEAWESAIGTECITSFETEADGTPCNPELAEMASKNCDLWNRAWEIAKAEYLTAK